MKLHTLHEECIRIGMDHDVRGQAHLEEELQKRKQAYEQTEGLERELFDTERLWNPFYDSRILNGRADDEVETLFAGIDVDVQQILLAHELRKEGEKIDCLFLHHPQGRASVEMANDMRLQIDMYRKYGVSEVTIEQQLEATIESTLRMSHTDNIFEWQRTAELLKFPALCIHTPADNMAYQYMEKYIAEKKYRNIGELEDALLEIPEFRWYAQHGIRPVLINCSRESRTGIVAPTGITGGTNGPGIFVAEQADASIGTILSMHASDEYKTIAQQHHINIIQLSHYAADTLGVNLLLDVLEQKHPELHVFEGCGFKRIKRDKHILKALRENARESEERLKKLEL